MPRKSAAKTQENLFVAKTKTAPCVPELRARVKAWKEGGYTGVTATTRALLNFWFRAEHRMPNRRKFEYHNAQREAIETLIYVYEVCGVRTQKNLIETFSQTENLKLLQHDIFPRYCLKMATGSGKTKVMALAIVWQYFNALLEDEKNFARTFLILAPNVIVYERLKTDFGDGKIFIFDPLIPNELSFLWDFNCYMKGDLERASSEGALYLTNIQQLQERGGGAEGSEPDPVLDVLGAPPPKKKIETIDFDDRIVARGGNCLVLNDEAHHTHDEESVWNQIIRNLHHGLSPANVIQLDLTATPRHQMGGLFAWTIYDYPLKQAILDNIVKRPLRGITTGIQELPSDTASVKYQAYLHAGVERWREYREALSPFDKKPLLFIMMNSTAEADDVAEHLRTKYPSDFGGEKLLVIHTDTKGEVSKKDLDAARELARQVDKNQCPVNAIVSVLMLREGWDVQNVTVIVGLRPYSSKANILPEQTIGRGLRMMFRGEGSTYVERVDIIGNKHFIDFVSDLEKDEDLQLETFNLKDPVVITNIHPDPDKMDRDILLPELSPLLTRKKTISEEINAIDVKLWKMQTLPVRDSDAKAKEFRYEGKDILTLKMEIERDYSIPEPQTAQEVIGYYARKIAADIKLPSQFANIVPKVREFLELRAFGEPVDIETPAMIKAIATPIVAYVTIKEFRNALRNISIEELTPQLLTTGRRLSETAPYASSRKTFVASKTIFNLVDPGNEFEKRFARCLEDCPDVVRFSKLPSQFNFQIDYTDNAGNLRFYEPDFVAVLVDGSQWILETKGREDIDVAHKDRAAILWCENASRLTETDWRYLKIPEKEFDSLNPFYFSDLTLAL